MTETTPNSDSLDTFRRPVWQTILGTALLGLSFFVLALAFPNAGILQGGQVWIALMLAIWLLALTAIDLDRFLLPDWLTLPLIALGWLYAYLHGVGWLESLIGSGVGYGLIAILEWHWRANLGREGIGLGDAKLLSAIGAWCGIFALPIALLVASASVLGLILCFNLFTKTIRRETAIPFGPGLGLGFWVALFLT